MGSWARPALLLPFATWAQLFPSGMSSAFSQKWCLQRRHLTSGPQHPSVCPSSMSVSSRSLQLNGSQVTGTRQRHYCREELSMGWGQAGPVVPVLRWEPGPVSNRRLTSWASGRAANSSQKRQEGQKPPNSQRTLGPG